MAISKSREAVLWSTGINVGPSTQKEWQEQESSEQTREGVASMLWKEAGEDSLEGWDVFPWKQTIFTFKELFNGTA